MSERLDRAEAILLVVAEQTAENSRIVVENSRAIAENSRAIAENTRIATENSRAITVINQTLQTLLEDRIEIYNILENLARDIAQLRDVSEQQNRAITYLISQD